MRALYVYLSAIVLGSCTSYAQDSVLGTGIFYDPGGFVAPYYAFAAQASGRKLPVEIRGICNSACALKLASGENLCIDRAAIISVHEVRTSLPGQTYDQSVRDEEQTEKFRKFLPPCAEELFTRRNGFSSGDFVGASGAEILDACPQIKSCP